MKKYFCDCCGNEVACGSLKDFSYPCHLDNASDLRDAYSDNEGNRISGRYITKELCNKCSNFIHSRAVGRMIELQEEYGKHE